MLMQMYGGRPLCLLVSAECVRKSSQVSHLTVGADGLPRIVQFLDGSTLKALVALNKIVRKIVAEETHIYTVSNPRFIHGEGYKSLV
jgi:hypothetical protein